MNDLKQSDTWKVQLTITINFISFKDDDDDDDEGHVMRSKSDDMEIKISDEADGVIKSNLLAHLKIHIIYNNLQSMRATEFVFDYVQLLYHKCYKINFSLGGS